MQQQNFDKTAELPTSNWIDDEIKKLKERKKKYPPSSYLMGVIDGSIATLESIKESKLKT